MGIACGIPMLTQHRAVFLDRDGVINQSEVKNGRPYAPTNLSGLKILPGVLDGLHRLRQANFLLIVITNQPDVAKGITSKETVEEIHHALMTQLPLDDIFACYHDDAYGCACRKPQPGAIFAAAKKHQIDLSKSYMLGDRWKDVAAGQQAGCKTLFIDYQYDEKQPNHVDFRVQSLSEAAHIILEDTL